MREILFRAKTNDGEWVEGYNVKCRGHHYILPVYDTDHGFDERYAEWVEVAPETVCQYTGLTDKNGRKIFEGDIVSFDYELNDWGKVAKILFEDGEYRYRAVTNFPELYNCRICGENDRCDVIGNIFDNPDLIGDQP